MIERAHVKYNGFAWAWTLESSSRVFFNLWKTRTILFVYKMRIWFTSKRDMAMRRIFWGFWRSWFLMSPLHYLSGHSNFGFEFDGDIRIRKTTPRYHRYRESAIEFFKRKLSVSMMRWVADSPYRWVGESPTPRITDTESRWLRVSLSRGVDNSAYQWYGESLFEEKN